MSLTQEALAHIEQLVEDYMRMGRPFTSLDIANTAKRNGFFARNRWVAEWLRSHAIQVAHDMGALYNQVLIEVDSKAEGQTLAYLYIHMNDDPDIYLDRDQNPISAPPQHRASPNDWQVRSSRPSGPGYTQSTPTTPGSFTTQGGGTHASGRDSHGRFASGNTPTNWRNQQRDGKGRFGGNR